MFTALSLSFISAGAIIFFSRRLLCYLRHFQEGGYSRGQFKHWAIANKIYDKKGSLIATIAAFTIELTGETHVSCLVISIIAAVALIWLAFWENDPRKCGPFQLQETQQAAAIYNLSLGLYSIAFPLAVFVTHAVGAGDEIACYWLLVILAIQSSPLWLVLASKLLNWRSH
jgi:hypothetical protein